ncbi:hypothetical protein AYI88_15210 [Shewanella algae]|nr:hypothetical protein AYI88_15210 [Shewanella algae]
MENILEFIINWFDGLHPFFQNLCAAAAFAIASWLLRILAGKIKRSGSEFFVAYQKMDMYKHLVHKELVSSSELVNFSKGYFIITLEAFRWAFKAVLIPIFFLGVSAIVNGDWWMLLCYWFMLNCMLEASTWLKDKSSESEISYINEEIKEEFYSIMYPEKDVEQKPNKQLNKDAAEDAAPVN